ncbi:MAG TPA: NAD(P)/FAD-dependent oxidoreductase, partial [Ktedonobacteraceae bacterium]|nr:NAD(P)/FAD-dependent oxidoreductase [Ktedonobacteraceae bacterium]
MPARANGNPSPLQKPEGSMPLIAEHPKYDAIVIGSGPNGLAAAITMALAGQSVAIFEAKDTIGGGCRSQEITLPRFIHDVCSAVHPLALDSSFFASLPLEQFGMEMIQPSAPLAHPLDNGTAVMLERSIEATAAGLGKDARAYHKLMTPFVTHWNEIKGSVREPLGPQIALHPFARANFALKAIRSAHGLAKSVFEEERASAIFAGMCAHSMMSLEQSPTAGTGLLLGILGHAVGWPIARGGSQKIVDALAAYLLSLGGEIFTDVEVKSIDALPPARVILCDITPRQLLRIAGNYLPNSYQWQLKRYRYGPGIFKIDYALDGPIPWKAEECLRAGTVHIGGTFSDVAASEQAVSKGEHPEKPFVLVAQQSLFDSTRAPEGKQTAWVYCHVPNGSTFDMTERIESQIERFAPGFRDRVLAKNTMNSLEVEHHNANYIGGDINGGIQDLWQFFTRPAIRPVPYTTPAK